MMILNRISNYWLCQIAGWGFVTLSYIFFGYTFRKLTEPGIIRLALFILAGLLVTHFLRWSVKQLNWLMLPIEKGLPRFLMATIIACVLAGFMVASFASYFEYIGVIVLDKDDRTIDFSTRLLTTSMDQGLYITPWVLIYYFYHYIEKSRRQQLDTLKLEALVKELELKTIKSHINPHFIFNALNSIRALIDENPGRARNAITELSNILRSSMQAEKQETVSFEKELNIVKDYLALEHIRFEDRLKVEYQIDEDTLDQPVPPMMLQTLVENAIKHGIGREITGGYVKVSSDFRGNFHELVIQNSGKLNGQMNDDGFGLSSTKNRLQLLFGDKANFEIKQVNGNMVEARVLIPVELK